MGENWGGWGGCLGARLPLGFNVDVVGAGGRDPNCCWVGLASPAGGASWCAVYLLKRNGLEGPPAQSRYATTYAALCRIQTHSPLQRRILLDVLAVLIQGGGADALQLPPAPCSQQPPSMRGPRSCGRPLQSCVPPTIPTFWLRKARTSTTPTLPTSPGSASCSMRQQQPPLRASSRHTASVACSQAWALKGSPAPRPTWPARA
jgi:hypothetical protein